MCLPYLLFCIILFPIIYLNINMRGSTATVVYKPAICLAVSGKGRKGALCYGVSGIAYWDGYLYGEQENGKPEL